MTTENAIRADRGEKLLRLYDALLGEEDAPSLGDLIADVLHYAHREGGEDKAAHAHEMGWIHFRAEQDGED